MTMVICKECKAHISTLAVACLHCGASKRKTSNIQEVRARGGEMFVFADADSHFGESEQVHVIRTPRHVGVLSPIVHTIPVQLLAYHTALARGTDVDKPRNLAKSVTVE